MLKDKNYNLFSLFFYFYKNLRNIIQLDYLQ